MSAGRFKVGDVVKWHTTEWWAMSANRDGGIVTEVREATADDVRRMVHHVVGGILYTIEWPKDWYSPAQTSRDVPDWNNRLQPGKRAVES